MKQILYTVFFLLCLSLSTFAAEENPLKKAKVGDWAKYDMEIDMKDLSMNGKGTVTQTVIGKSDIAITLEIVIDLQISGIPANKETTEQKIDLTKPFSPWDSTEWFTEPIDRKIKEVKSGNQKLVVAGKTFDCRYTEYECEEEEGEKTLVRLWTSSAEVFPLIKMSMTSGLDNVSVILNSTGKK